MSVFNTNIPLGIHIKEPTDGENIKGIYLFEIWQYGYKTDSITFDNLFAARRFYIQNRNAGDFAIILYINGERIDFMKVCEKLKISNLDRRRYSITF